MERNDRRNRYRDNDYRSSNHNDRNRNYNSRDNYFDRDHNFNNSDRNTDWGPGQSYNYDSNQNRYSNDRDESYWSNRQQMNDSNRDRNDISYGNRDYNRPDSSYMNNDNRNRPWYENNNNRYRNDEWRNSRNEGWRDNYRNENWRDNYRNENDGNDRDWWDKTKDEVSSWFGDDEAARRRRMDEYREGQHRGKGPKNYSRSPERIKEDVSDKLSDDSLLDASNVEIEVNNNEVTLTGSVDTRYEKRRAEDLAENVSGVTNVQNNLRVVSKNTNYNSGYNTNLGNNSSYSATKDTTEVSSKRSS